MLKFVKEIPIQQRDVRFPLRSNSSVSAVPIRLDLDGDGRNDATRWLVSNCSWDPQGSAPAILKLLIRDADMSVEREETLPGKIGRVFGPTAVRLDHDGDGLADSTFAFAGHFDPDCQMMWDLDDSGSVEQPDSLNRLTPENEGPHGIAFARLDRDGDGVPDVTRVFYTGELTHRCTAYEIDDRTRRARVLCHFSEGDCCRSILSQRLDLDGDGRSDTTRLFVSLIDLLDVGFGAVKVYDLPDDTDIVQYRNRIPSAGAPIERIRRATGTAVVRFDLDGDGRLDTTRYFAGSQGDNEIDGGGHVGVFDVDEATCEYRHAADLRVGDSSKSATGILALRIDRDGDGIADLTRVFVSLLNRIAVFDVSDDGVSELRTIADLYDHSYVYSICPLLIDADGDGTIDRAYVALTDSWGNRLAIYSLELDPGETVVAANPPTMIDSDDQLRFASDETYWGAGLYAFTNYERLRVYQLQIARDAQFQEILHEDFLDHTLPLAQQPRWGNVTYDVGAERALTAYTIEAPGAYSAEGLSLSDRYHWRVRGRDPVAQVGWSSWVTAEPR